MHRGKSDTASLRTEAALLLVDVQVDFCPGGALPVPAGDRVIPVLNRAIGTFCSHRRPVYASRDWHPVDSEHFRTFGGRWPVHCVAGSPGAAFHPDLQLPADTITISKGLSRTDDGYSAFEGMNDQGQSLIHDLRQRQINCLYVGGLAADYCVRASVMDARKAGLDVIVLADGVAGISVDATRRAFEDMRAAGATLAQTDELYMPAELRKQPSVP